jgi:hypothetical protein
MAVQGGKYENNGDNLPYMYLSILHRFDHTKRHHGESDLKWQIYSLNSTPDKISASDIIYIFSQSNIQCHMGNSTAGFIYILQ